MEMLDVLISLLALIALEVVLGIDNIIFISILSDKLPEGERRISCGNWDRAGNGHAPRSLLAVISWVMKLETDFITIAGMGFSGKEMILLVGGIFLLYKSTREIFHMTETLKEARRIRNAIRSAPCSVRSCGGSGFSLDPSLPLSEWSINYG